MAWSSAVPTVAGASAAPCPPHARHVRHLPGVGEHGEHGGKHGEDAHGEHSSAPLQSDHHSVHSAHAQMCEPNGLNGSRMGPGGSRSAPPGEHGEAVGFAWSMEADPVGPCAVCTQACYSRGPNGRQRRAPGAGLLPARWRSASAQCLGVEAVVDRLIDLGERPAPGARSEGADLVHAILAGADCIDDTEVLAPSPPWRCSATGSWLPRPSARFCGFTFGPGRRPSHRGRPRAVEDAADGAYGAIGRPSRYWRRSRATGAAAEAPKPAWSIVTAIA